ncbi:RNA-binding domain-containing protein [Rickenella mellea]|uniref:RNA-binding domain-containing protein n=1 Tax=Rickenella mellea TaxID=50990 RepID=A0A4R5XEQ8_9AGAM|nr:RNA-binding domain-containing protein [Rickenella mellea]
MDPYSESYTQASLPPPAAPLDARDRGGYRSPPPSTFRRRSPAPKRPNHAPIAPNPSNVLGVFGLSIRTTERDLDEEFTRFGRVEKVTIVYDQRSDRSRGFGFIRMASVEDATRCIQELNGIDLNGRRIRVDYSVTDRPHAPTPGEYMGHRRSSARDSRREPYRDAYRERDYGRRDYDRDRYDRYDRDRDPRDRDPFGRDNRDWRERRSPPPRSGGGGRYSPDRRRRSYSRSPPRGTGSSPVRGGRDYDALPPAGPPPPAAEHRW